MECISFCGGQSFFPSKAGNRQCAASPLFRRTRTRDSNRPLRLKASDPADGPPSARPIRLAVHGGKAGGRSGNARASRTEARANVTRTGAKLKNLRFSDAGDVTDEALHGVGPSAALPALIRASGGGKFTVSRLVARFRDVADGELAIGGVNVVARAAL